MINHRHLIADGRTLRNEYPVMTPKIEEFRQANGMVNEPAVLFMDNCIRVNAMTVPPHTSATFQMLDLVFLCGVFKRIKKHLAKNPSVPMMEDHAMPTSMACDSAGTSSIVRGSFIRVGDTLGLDERKVHAEPEFREVWGIDFPLEKLNLRWRASP
jgi:hypothetical protein